jgi:hypothetical protein
MNASAVLNGLEPIRIMPNLLRRRYEELTERFYPLPVEGAFIHEVSTRGNVFVREILRRVR